MRERVCARMYVCMCVYLSFCVPLSFRLYIRLIAPPTGRFRRALGVPGRPEEARPGRRRLQRLWLRPPGVSGTLR